MQKLGIFLLFFTLCLATVSSAKTPAKNNGGLPNIDSILAHVNLDSIMHRVNVDSIMHSVNVDSILNRVNVDSIMQRVNIDSLLHGINIDSILKVAKSKIEGALGSNMEESAPSPLDLSGTIIESSSNAPKLSHHYFALNGKRYYMNMLPAKKATRVDHSYAWLLGER